MPASFRTVTSQDAQIIADAAIAAASKIAVKATLVVLDAGGSLVLATRMDGAWTGALDLALAKARTAHAFAAPSGYFTPIVQPGGPLFGVGAIESGRYLPLPGGFPITFDGDNIGAVGVSGGSPDQDAEIAQAGVDGFSNGRLP